MVCRPEVQPSQWGVPTLLLLPPDDELQHPGGGEQLQSLPLLRELQSPRAQSGGTGQAELYNIHAGKRNSVLTYVRGEIYQTVLQNPNISFGKYFKTFQAGCSNSHSLEVKTQCEESGGQKSSTNKQCRQSLPSVWNLLWQTASIVSIFLMKTHNKLFQVCNSRPES